MITRSASPLAPGIPLSRYLTALVLARGNANDAAIQAKAHFADSPQVAAALVEVAKAVGAGTTASGGGPLAQFGLSQDFLPVFDSASLFGRLKPAFRRAPFRSKTHRELGSGAGGAWITEGIPRPVARSSWDALQQGYAAGVTTIPVSRELFRFDPVAELAVRNAVIAGAAKFLDGQLLDPTVSATASHPASLTNTGVEITTAGTSAANMITDLTALIAAIGTPGDALRFVMRPLTYHTICAKLAGVGYAVPPGMLLNIPVELGSTSPQQIALIDGSSVIASWDDELSVEVATDGTLEMLDSALQQDGTVGTGTQLVSLWQAGLAAVRVDMPVYWQSASLASTSPDSPGCAWVAVTY